MDEVLMVSLWFVVGVAGGFAPHPGHDVHLHPTLSAIQILATHNSLHLLNKEKITTCEFCFRSSALRLALVAAGPPIPLLRPTDRHSPRRSQSSCRSKTRSAARSGPTRGPNRTRASRTAPFRPSRSSASSTAWTKTSR